MVVVIVVVIIVVVVFAFVFVDTKGSLKDFGQADAVVLPGE